MTIASPAPQTPQTTLRPITMAILAMGGEGGGVLSDWTVALAEANGYYAQSTSVAGVAQRTGATVYYVELFPRFDGDAELPYPVLSTMPTPGEVDIVVASELMEAGRAIQRGFVTPDRSTLIASTSRTYSMPERTAMGDGRVDSQGIIDAAKGASATFIRGDFARVAEESRSVISAVLFGAICGADVLPFTRDQFEDAIRLGGKGVETSLAAFDGGYRVASAPPAVDIQIGLRPASATTPQDDPSDSIARSNAAALVGDRLQAQARRIMDEFPAAARPMLVHGIKRTAEYQGISYADAYLDRVARVRAFENDPDGEARLTTETARYVALWMTYEDTIRVAFHKTRERRFARIEGESRVGDEDIMQVHEYLHPQIEEITDTLPTALGRWMLRTKWINALVYRVTHKGIKIQTSSLWGFTVLYLLARLRPIRPRSLRFALEQERIDAWLDRVCAIAPSNYALACEVVELQQLVKGYGETHANGMRNFTAIMDVLSSFQSSPDAASTAAKLRSAALADESGRALRQTIDALPTA